MTCTAPNETGRPPRCSVVILNFNGATYTLDCYRSVTAQTFIDREIIILDNASTDGSPDILARECPEARLIRNPINEGTGGGFAAGAREARGELILFLCNDTVLDPDVIGKMVQVMDDRPDCGVCGAKQVYFDRPDIIDCLGYRPDRFGFPAFFAMKQADDGDTSVHDAWVNGSVFMIRRDLYERVGGYDPMMFTLVDEVDLGWRVRMHGYTTLVCAAARVRHHNSATLSLEKKARTRHWSERHMQRMLLKNYSLPTLLWIGPQYAALWLAEIGFLSIQGLFGIAWADIRALGWNIRHFGNTWQHHRRLQQSRTVSDRVIIRALRPGSVKIEWGLLLWRTRSSFRSGIHGDRSGSGMPTPDPSLKQD